MINRKFAIEMLIIALALAIRSLYLIAFIDDTDYMGPRTYNILTAGNFIENNRFEFSYAGIYGGVDEEPYTTKTAATRPLALAGLHVLTYKLSGSINPLLIRILHILIDSAMCLLAGWIAMMLFGRKWRLMGALAWAVYLPVIWLAIHPTEYIWMVWFSLAATAILISRYSDTKRLILLSLLTLAGFFFRNECCLLILMYPALNFAFGTISKAKLFKWFLAAITTCMLAMLLNGLFHYMQFNRFQMGHREIWMQAHYSFYKWDKSPKPMLDTDGARYVSKRAGRKIVPYSEEFFMAYKQFFIEDYMRNPLKSAKIFARGLAYKTALIINKPSTWGPEKLSPSWARSVSISEIISNRDLEKAGLLMFRISRRLLMLASFILGIMMLRRLWQNNKKHEVLVLLSLIPAFAVIPLVFHVEPCQLYGFRWFFYLLTCSFLFEMLKAGKGRFLLEWLNPA
ncbi:hypothetical protein ACFL6Y_07255 [Elusimicrobiota bacterium]